MPTAPKRTIDWPVQMAGDGLTAELYLGRAEGGEAVDLEQVADALARGGVVMDDVIREQIAAALKGGRPEVVVVSGEPAVDGEDGCMAWGAGMSPRERPRPSENQQSKDAAGAVDYYAHSKFINVQKNELIAHVVEPTAGEVGRDLRGREIAAVPGEPAEIEVDDASIRREDDGACYARIDGVLSFEAGRVAVEEQLTIKGNVDFDTGSIDVLCPVQVAGAVRDRFVIATQRDLSVRGLIEAATIRTGGDFEAAGGVAGKQRGRLEIGGDMKARYLNQVEADVRGDAVIEREIMQCMLNVGGGLRMERGALISGRVSVTGESAIGQIGSDSDEPTVIELGIDRRIEACIAEADRAIRKLERQRGQGEQRRGEIEAMGPRHASRFGDELRQLDDLAVLIARRHEHLERKRKRLLAKYAAKREVKLRVGRVIHRRTQIVTAGCRAELRQPLKGPLWVMLDEAGKLIFKDERDGGSMAIEGVATVRQLVKGNS
ncbi:MAG: FapA family protein [Phycisphaeraceae bacterium]